MIPKTKAQYRNELIRRAKAGLFPSSGGNTCYYRKNRRKNCKIACAVGILIPDEKYSSRLEGGFYTSVSTAADPIQQQKLHDAVQIPKGVTKNQLKRLQGAHDRRNDGGNKWTPKIVEDFCNEVREILK